VVANRLLIQPGAGVGPLIEGIDAATEIIQIVIFRFDRGDVEMALKRAAKRGVFVHALVAYTSSGQGGEQLLRKLEMRLLSDGISVARTAVDLARYHDKLMIVDKRLLFMLGFNYTYLDIERSRSFGIISEDPEWVNEAERLFTADTTGQTYIPECDSFLVSPGNSRAQLLDFLSRSKKQLLIYDGKLSDPEMMRLLAEKVQEGVDVRVIGAVGKQAVGVAVAPLQMRLHAQAIVRDGEEIFLGSQSMRSIELDARREVGVLLKDPEITAQVKYTFESDWTKIHSTHKVVPAAGIDTPVVSDNDPGVYDISAAACAQMVQTAVKEAIMDAVKETLQVSPDMVPLKSTVREAAKEALAELAG
jgi:phosphatidylserine/phosphatidylglycerophosphate/cardiolipin synthase-like enzyme